MSSNLTFAFADKVPERISLSRFYEEPKNPKRAEYNSGEGWKPYTDRVIPIYGNQVSFRGDWRDRNGTYYDMFSETFNIRRGVNNVAMFGTLEYDANNTPGGYASMFQECDGIKYMRDDPIPKLKGKIADSMLQSTFHCMRGLTKLPDNFLDMTEMYGFPEAHAFSGTCLNMLNVSSPHIFKFGDMVKFNPDMAVECFRYTWGRMRYWTGTVLWGDKVLFDAVVPQKRMGAVYGCVNMMGYDDIHIKWK